MSYFKVKALIGEMWNLEICKRIFGQTGCKENNLGQPQIPEYLLPKIPNLFFLSDDCI